MGIEKPNYTQIPNLLLDDLMVYMSGAELKVALVIARQTFGYHRERYPMTINVLEELTGLSRPAIVEAISTGERRGLIARDEVDGGRFAYRLIISGETLATGKENLPPAVKKVNRRSLANGPKSGKESLPTTVKKVNCDDDGKENLPPAVKKVNRRSKETLPESVKEVNRLTPVLKKEKESIKERLVGGDPTNQPIFGELEGDGEPEQEPDREVAHALSFSLLLACHVGRGKAKAIADAFPFAEIRRQVCDWLPFRAKASNPSGLLIHRIETHHPAGDLTPEFKRERLYLDYLTPAEKREREEAEAEATALYEELRQAQAPPPPPQPQPPAAPVDKLQALWVLVLREVFTGQPPDAAMRYWLGDSRVAEEGTRDNGAGIERPLYRVYVARPDGVQWLNNRLAGTLGRVLASVLGQRVIVEVAYAGDP